MASVRKRIWVYKGVERSAWVATYTDQRGKRVQKTFKQKKPALKYRTQVETEIEKGIHTADSASVSVRKAGEHWLGVCERRLLVGDQMAKTTILNYRFFFKKYIIPFWGETKLSQLTAKGVQKWVNNLVYDETNPKKPPTVDRAIACLSLILTEAQREHWVGHNVIKDVAPRRRRVERGQNIVPSKKDIKTILNESSGRTNIMIHMAAFTGMRISEICGLTWDNVDLQNGVIHISQKANRWGEIGPPKSKSGYRDIPIATNLSQMLKEWYLGCPKGEKNPDGLVFPSRRGRSYAPNGWVADFWRPLMRKIGLVTPDGRPGRNGSRVKFKFHDLRHFAASLLIEQGLPSKQIQRIMGHATIAMTFDTYGHLFDEGDSHSVVDAMERDILA